MHISTKSITAEGKDIANYQQMVTALKGMRYKANAEYEHENRLHPDQSANTLENIGTGFGASVSGEFGEFREIPAMVAKAPGKLVKAPFEVLKSIYDLVTGKMPKYDNDKLQVSIGTVGINEATERTGLQQKLFALDRDVASMQKLQERSIPYKQVEAAFKKGVPPSDMLSYVEKGYNPDGTADKNHKPSFDNDGIIRSAVSALGVNLTSVNGAYLAQTQHGAKTTSTTLPHAQQKEQLAKH